MKTKHIIAIGLLSALAVGILGLAIYTGKAKPKTMVKAEDDIVTIFNETGNLPNTQYTAESGNKFQIIGNYTINYQRNYTTNQYNFSINLSYYLQSNNIIPAYVYLTNSTQNFNVSYTTTNEIENDTGIEIDFTELIFVYSGTNTTRQQFDFYINDTPYNRGLWTSYYAVQNGREPSLEQLNNAFQETEYFATLLTTTITYSQEFLIRQAYETGYNTGYNTGYGIGYNDSDAFNHPIDLAGTMLQVLTMPFTFISQAFDVTLWPETQYQINIGNFIKAMLAISAILFIIKLFTSGFSIIGNYTSSRTDANLKRSQTKLNKAKTEKIKKE